MKKQSRKIRYAVVGLGHIAQAAVLPAFSHARKNSELAALVSDNLEKQKALSRRYNVPCYSYAEYETLLKSGAIDAVYIALPNSMHRKYSVKAALAGIHILCEKPMATSEADARMMIMAAAKNNIRLMIAYRLYFDQASRTALQVAHSGKIGALRFFNSIFSVAVPTGNIRTKRALGGGTLWDLGIYCVNAARFFFKSEPVEVSAFCARKIGDKRFVEIEEMTAVQMRFPDDRLATFISSFGAADSGAYDVLGTKGSLRMSPGYGYHEPLVLSVTIDEKTTKTIFPKRDQFAAELIYFSDCILNRKKVGPSGEEGLADVRVIEALYRSARSGRAVSLAASAKTKHPL